MSGKKTEALAKELAAPLAEALGYELVDVEFVKEGQYWYLRIYIDKEGGVTLEDCQNFSHRFDETLEQADPIQSAYFLEVSSPGLDRPLKKEEDFRRYLDREIEVSLYTAVEGNKQYKGTNKGLEADILTLTLPDGTTVQIPYKNVASARLHFEF
jgi:ribosome maturation factor RimP